MAAQPAPSSVIDHGRERVSKGYIPVEVETLRDRQLTDGGLRLLMLVRRASDERQSDGFLDDLDLVGLGVAAGWTVSRTRRLCAELVELNYLERGVRGVLDVNFHEWCRTSEKRAADRKRYEKWRLSKAPEVGEQ